MNFDKKSINKDCKNSKKSIQTLGKHALGKHALGEHALGEHALGKHALNSDYFSMMSFLDSGSFKLKLLSRSGVQDFETAHASLELIKKNPAFETNFEFTIYLEPDWTTLASAVSISAFDRASLPLDSQYVKTDAKSLFKSSFSKQIGRIFSKNSGPKNLHFILLGKGLSKVKNRPNAPDRHFFLSALLIPVLSRICYENNIHFIHSACLEKRKFNDKTIKKIMICGPKSSGKTTMTLCLEKMGFQILGDDITMLFTNRPNEKNFMVTGLNEPILLKNPKFLDFLNPNSKSGIVLTNQESAKNINKMQEKVTIIFPEVSNEKSVKLIKPAEAFYRLMNAPADGITSHFGACGAALKKMREIKKESHLAAFAAQCNSLFIPSGAWAINNRPCPEKLLKIINANQL